MKVDPLYFMLPLTISCSYAFMLPIATGPNAIIFDLGKMENKDLVSFMMFFLSFSHIFFTSSSEKQDNSRIFRQIPFHRLSLHHDTHVGNACFWFLIIFFDMSLIENKKVYCLQKVSSSLPSFFSTDFAFSEKYFSLKCSKK